MARFKNISGGDVHVGRADGRLCEAGTVVAVDGDLLAELDDAYIVGAPDDVLTDPETKEPVGYTDGARAWPKSQWELVPEAGAAKSSKKDGE